MITLYNCKKSKIERVNGIPSFLVELRGLSTDTKPTIWENGIIENGSVYIEIDTGKVNLYDLETEEWIEV